MRSRLPAALLLMGALGLAACSSATPETAPTPGGGATAPTAAPGASVSAPATTAAPRVTPSRTPSLVEPTTTNTLPPPPRPSRPAPSTAGQLTAKSLPVPAGWHTVVRKGSSEEGYLGNGTWVHERDPRYAANAVIAIGCADVTRDDYPDPESALEGTYERKGQPGIGLVLQFASSAQAGSFWDEYLHQVTSCTTGAQGQVKIKVLTTKPGLTDRRTYPEEEWTEASLRDGARITLIILSDPGHRITATQAQTLLRQIQTV